MVANWNDYRRRAAQTIIAANPGASFTGPQPAQWQGIATVTVMLNADGSVRALDLMRGSRVAPHVNDMALLAARRAANYGPVSNLPQPWQFNETFLYNDDNKFQLITIVEGR
jgi:outer membrane biosynthesis protein TonB